MKPKMKYCLPIIKPQTKQVLEVISKHKDSYDYFEIWLDYIQDLDLDFIKKLSKEYGKKIIFLFRRQYLEKPKLSSDKRIAIINLLSNTDSILDLDINSQKKEIDYIKRTNKNIALIISYHNYKKTPSLPELNQLILKMIKIKGQIIKVSTFCRNDSDALNLIDLLVILKEKEIKCIVLGMGPKGKTTRIAGAILGNEINFAPLTLKNKSSSGQLTKNNLEKIIRQIKICYFVANPVNHSLSPKMHYAGYKALGIEDDFIFLRKKVKSEDLQNFVSQIRKVSNFKGASISIPHKVEIMNYLDSIDTVAKKIGAVNTIVKIGRKLKGYNTDYLGILNPIKEILPNLKNRTVGVIGAGGAARAAVYALRSEGAKVTIFNRTLKNAQELGTDFGCEYDSLDNINKLNKFDIIIHTTKIGLNKTDLSLVPKNTIVPNQIVFDAVYSKDFPETKLIKNARQRKAIAISGIDMLIYQGVAQFELLTGKEVSVDVLRRSL